MGFLKKDNDKNKKKPVEVVPIPVTKKKNNNMWCPMHNCPKTGCPTMHD